MRLNLEASIQMRDSILMTGGCEPHRQLDHLAVLGLEDVANHIVEQVEVLAVEGAQDADRKHVLSLLCIFGEAEGFPFERDFDNGRSTRTKPVEHLAVGQAIPLVLVRCPLVVDQHEDVVGEASCFEAGE